jgi:hypothetical protein
MTELSKKAGQEVTMAQVGRQDIAEVPGVR